MSEGKLKKRNIEFANQAKQRMGSPTLYPNISGFQLQEGNVTRELFDYRDNIKILLDEAEAEFPKPLSLMGIIMEPQIKEYKEWCEKWFGKSYIAKVIGKFYPPKGDE